MKPACENMRVSVRGVEPYDNATQSRISLPAEVPVAARVRTCSAHAVQGSTPRRGFPSRLKNDWPRNRVVVLKPRLASHTGEGSEAERRTPPASMRRCSMTHRGRPVPGETGKRETGDRYARLDQCEATGYPARAGVTSRSDRPLSDMGVLSLLSRTRRAYATERKP